jgi:hypothetical protein
MSATSNEPLATPHISHISNVCSTIQFHYCDHTGKKVLSRISVGQCLFASALSSSMTKPSTVTKKHSLLLAVAFDIPSVVFCSGRITGGSRLQGYSLNSRLIICTREHSLWSRVVKYKQLTDSVSKSYVLAACFRSNKLLTLTLRIEQFLFVVPHIIWLFCCRDITFALSLRSQPEGTYTGYYCDQKNLKPDEAHV